MNNTWTRKLALLVLLGGLVMGLVGCDDVGALYELAALFLPEVASYKFLGTTGDPGIDALFKAKAVFANIDAADALMAQGRENGAPEVMEKAIDKRPHDWHYRVEAAILYLDTDDPESQQNEERAQVHLAQARKDVPDREADQIEYSLAVIENFEDIKTKRDANGWSSWTQCQTVHDELINNYRWYRVLSGEHGESPRATELESDKKRCGGQ